MGKKEWNDPKLEVLDINMTMGKKPGKPGHGGHPHESHSNPDPQNPGFS